MSYNLAIGRTHIMAATVADVSELLGRLELFDGSRLELQAPEGESWQDVINRLTKLLNDMYEHYPNGHVLLISHGWTLRVLRFLLTDLSLEESLADHIDNASAQMWLMTHTLDSLHNIQDA